MPNHTNTKSHQTDTIVSKKLKNFPTTKRHNQIMMHSADSQLQHALLATTVGDENSWDVSVVDRVLGPSLEITVKIRKTAIFHRGTHAWDSSHYRRRYESLSLLLPLSPHRMTVTFKTGRGRERKDAVGH